MTDDASSRSRLMTRWIGSGIGGAMLITALSLTFARSCVTSAQSHVLAVVLALGAAFLLWGIVGGLQIDVKLKFKALGEVTAAGVAAIFLVVHFVSSDGIVSSEDCGAPVKTPDHVLHGRVHEAGQVTRGIEGAVVKIELPDGIADRITDAEGQFDRSIDGDIHRVKLWAIKDGYEDSAVIEVDLPLADPKVVIEMTKAGSATPTDVSDPRLPTVPIPRLPLDPVSTVDTQPRVESGLRINTNVDPTAAATEQPKSQLELLP
ncbi:MAG: hypothetical protein KC501_31065 [Myxococcales bacterium]|nr:hypothetical protein [Myxococcales bacterium]